VLFTCKGITAAVSVERSRFGATASGEIVDRFRLEREGVTAELMSYGAALLSLTAPDRSGRPGHVVLGFDSLAPYLGEQPYLGATIGRYANRIAGARFRLEGREIRLSANEKGNHLHGGERGFGRVVWRWEPFETGAAAGVRFFHRSDDGEEGYPGTLDAEVAYALGPAGELRIDYRATTDRTTVVNLTHHSYFNLRDGGASQILSHQLQIEADAFLVVDRTGLPTGEIRPVAGTPLDFRSPCEIGARIDSLVPERAGYDHCFALRDRGEATEPRLAARVLEPETGRVLELSTTQPGLQLYTGNFLGGLAGRGDTSYGRWQALCLEPQDFPDAPNQPGFPSTTLEPGQQYAHTAIFRFGVGTRSGALPRAETR
jgi:aldose 1-epimerase